ncbi:uncharacterized protein LOC118430997 isoform X1 [Branchiostoma floridae]|uniref:Uncharacterized protein LOC118430997 isoform X1 n=1 Tax=Branchiostoma floridae TaxID=7739 RepID=A0A9J7MBT8_BRAFL|nr:uncharacterized protein LOC118430997 isoform X1 [Branchiostoma floridae]
MSASWVFLFGLLLGVSVQVVHGNFFDGLKEGLSNFGDGAKEWGEGVGDSFRNFGKGAWDKINQWKDSAMDKFLSSDSIPERVKGWIRGGDYSDAKVDELVGKILPEAWNARKLEDESKCACKLKLGGADAEGNQKLWLFRSDEKGGLLYSTDARGDGRSFARFRGTWQEMRKAMNEVAPEGQDKVTVPGNQLNGNQPVMWKVEDEKIFRGEASEGETVWRDVAFCSFKKRSKIKDRTRQVQNGETSTIGGKDVASPAETTPAPENRATKVTESSRHQDDEGSETFSGKYPPAPREV